MGGDFVNFIDKITLENLEDEQKEIAETIGLEKYIQLVKNFGGTSIYVHKAQTLERAIRDEEIRKDFKGDYKSLALKYSLSISQVRDIVDKKNKDIEISQISLL